MPKTYTAPIVHVYLSQFTAEEVELVKNLARAEKMPLSQWVRTLILREIRKQEGGK